MERHGTNRSGAGQRIDRQAESENSIVDEVTQRQKIKADIVHAAVTFAVIQKRGIEFPFMLFLGVDGRGACSTKECAGRGRQGYADLLFVPVTHR